MYFFENTVPGTYNMHSEQPKPDGQTAAMPLPEQDRRDFAQRQGSVGRAVPPPQVEVPTVLCVLPTGAETLLEREECRQRSGVIFRD